MIKKYSILELNEVVEGVFSGVNAEAGIRHLLLDSRKLAYVDNTLFFALKGLHHDGHRFIKELYERGLRNFVVTRLPENRFLLEDANFIIVKDSLKALQQIAAYHKKQFSLPTIGITGSNGKTIVKEWLNQLLNEDYEIVRSPKSYNSQVGVPLSVWQINEDHELAIFEAGISQVGEMGALEAIIQPTIGLFTNIGHAHGRNFEAQKTKVDEKLKLFYNCDKLYYCLDHKIIHERIQKTPELKDTQLIGWSRYNESDLRVEQLHKSRNYTEITVAYKGEKLKFMIPFTDDASVENVMHCIAIALDLGVRPSQLEHRLEKLAPLAMRLELKEGVNNCAIINDSYSSDLESLQIALEFMSQQQLYEKKTVILSDLLQSARKPVEVYEDVAMLLKRNNVQQLIGIGEEISSFKELFPLECHFFNDTEEFLNNFSKFEFREENILVKGARKFAFEHISQLLERKAHQTVLEIDLNALVHNLNVYRSKIHEDTKVMVMVKAFSYGSGSFEIANVLQFHRVDYLGVAFADEGVELRKAGIALHIMVMNPDESSFDSMVRYKLEPEIYNFRALEHFENALKYKKLKKNVKVHIKIDTGMHRLGFDPAQVTDIIARLKNHPKIMVQSVFTHLAASDEPEHQDFTLSQITQLESSAKELMDGLGYKIDRHVLNSSGIENYPEHQFEMVRLGIGIYGVGGFDNLLPVSTLRTTISQIRSIKKGESLGYGRKFIAPKQMKVATLPIGYADGLNRKLGNGNSSLVVNGKKANIIGDVCMDMCFIDISEHQVQEGDDVIIFGAENSLEQLAEAIGTIPYEVLTSISRRVKRIYYQE